jgi:hypothetical protein
VVQKKWILLVVIVCVVFFRLANATTDDQAAINDNGADSPPNVGNFALPAPQQPGPLLSFGQTLIGRNHVQIAYSNYTVIPRSGGGDNRNIELMYGFTDATALYFNYPLESNYSTRHSRFSSLNDAILQLEHAVYTAGNTNYQEQATVVGLMTLPLQSTTEVRLRSATNRHISVGYGAPVYFLGATYNRTYVDWLGFVSPGVLITSVSDNVKLGSQALYQAGLGHTIKTVTDRYIFLWLLEFQGQYTAKDEIFGNSLRDTGGNVISLAPSLWFSTQRLILQAGVNIPVMQHLNGNQTKTNYAIAAMLTWTIA